MGGLCRQNPGVNHCSINRQPKFEGVSADPIDNEELYVPVTDLCDGTAGLYVSDDDDLGEGEKVAATEVGLAEEDAWRHSSDMKKAFFIPLQTCQDDTAEEDAWRHLSAMTEEFFPITDVNEGVWSQTTENEPTTPKTEHSDHNALEPETDAEPNATVEDELPTENKATKQDELNNPA